MKQGRRRTGIAEPTSLREGISQMPCGIHIHASMPPYFPIFDCGAAALGPKRQSIGERLPCDLTHAPLWRCSPFCSRPASTSGIEFEGGQRLEGAGVTPDHHVERPLPYAAGADPVLDAAIDVLVKQAAGKRKED